METTDMQAIREALKLCKEILYAQADRGHYPLEALQVNGGNGLGFIADALAILDKIDKSGEGEVVDIEDAARKWYLDRYHVDVDECGYGHSAKRAVGDLVEFATLYRHHQQPTPPDPDAHLSDEDYLKAKQDRFAKGGLANVNPDKYMEEVKAILTKVDEVIECYFDTYGHMGGDAHDLQEEFRDIVLKHGLTL